MRNALDGILNRMRKIVHWINAPFISRVVMQRAVGDSVNNRVSHIDIRRCHINFCTKYALAVCKLTRFHLLKETQVFFHALVSARTLLARLFQSAAVFLNLLSIQAADISLALLD